MKKNITIKTIFLTGLLTLIFSDQVRPKKEIRDGQTSVGVCHIGKKIRRLKVYQKDVFVASGAACALNVAKSSNGNVYLVQPSQHPGVFENLKLIGKITKTNPWLNPSLIGTNPVDRPAGTFNEHTVWRRVLLFGQKEYCEVFFYLKKNGGSKFCYFVCKEANKKDGEPIFAKESILGGPVVEQDFSWQDPNPIGACTLPDGTQTDVYEVTLWRQNSGTKSGITATCCIAIDQKNTDIIKVEYEAGTFTAGQKLCGIKAEATSNHEQTVARSL